MNAFMNRFLFIALVISIVLTSCSKKNGEAELVGGVAESPATDDKKIPLSNEETFRLLEGEYTKKGYPSEECVVIKYDGDGKFLIKANIGLFNESKTMTFDEINKQLYLLAAEENNESGYCSQKVQLAKENIIIIMDTADSNGENAVRKIITLEKITERTLERYAGEINIDMEFQKVVGEINEFLKTSYTFEACFGGESGYDWEENEKNLLQMYPNIVSKDKDNLSFRLKNGSEKKLKSLLDPPKETDYTVFTLYRIDEGKDFAAVVETGYEWANALAINLNNGEEKYFKGCRFIDGLKTDCIVEGYYPFDGTFEINFYDVYKGNVTLAKTIKGIGLVYGIRVNDKVLIFNYTDAEHI